MKFEEKFPPRTYRCGIDQKIEISDCGQIELNADEQVTFVTPNGGEYDLARKSWGFYATPSINSRLKSFKLRTAMTRNGTNQFFIMLVEEGHEADFFSYLKADKIDFIAWLEDETLAKIADVVQ